MFLHPTMLFSNVFICKYTLNHMSYSRPVGTHHFMWPVRAYGGLKIKIYAALYRKYWNYVSIPQVFVSIWHSFYMQKLTLMCIWYAMVMIRDVGLRGWIKLIKRTSSSARAPPTEKHDILHSFNQLKKSIAAFIHDFLLILIVCLRRFLCSYFNDKCPELHYSLC